MLLRIYLLHVTPYITVFLINRLNNSRKIVRESRIFLVLQSVNCEVHHILNLSLFWFGVDGGNQKASSVITSCDIMHATWTYILIVVGVDVSHVQ